MTGNTYIADLTVAEFSTLFRSLLAEAQNPARPQPLRGVQGIADALQVSYSEAKRIKKSGLIDKAIKQHGRVILVDPDKARTLYTNSK